MNTPIVSFLSEYGKSGMSRFHMPGHKGAYGYPADITEIQGADDLYHASGIIAESETNASKLFGSRSTVYSTEGASLAIRTMLFLAVREWRKKAVRKERPMILAGRNAHKVFLYSAALIDFDVEWIYSEDSTGLCECRITPEGLRQKLASMGEGLPSAVYITSPDYLGNVADVEGLTEVAHSFGVPFLVDNAHGAYLKFLGNNQGIYRHPMELGADMCVDSAHKTLPAITGCAYLHIGENALYEYEKGVKEAMALFGSTSPSYLMLESLDGLNRILDESFTDELRRLTVKLDEAKEKLKAKGYPLKNGEPLKVVFDFEKTSVSGELFADYLRSEKIECEYTDLDHVVLMAACGNTDLDFDRLSGIKALKDIFPGVFEDKEKNGEARDPYASAETVRNTDGSVSETMDAVCTIREAMFAPTETIKTVDALGRVCGAPVVSCPPAIPIVSAGERIGSREISELLRYGHDEICVLI